MQRLKGLLENGLEATAAWWPLQQLVYGWVW